MRLALSNEKKLWILDEPFAALDAGAVDALSGRITEHANRGGVIVLTSHQDAPLEGKKVQRLALDAIATPS
jgi:heme exporter protein A